MSLLLPYGSFPQNLGGPESRGLIEVYANALNFTKLLLDLTSFSLFVPFTRCFFSVLSSYKTVIGLTLLCMLLRYVMISKAQMAFCYSVTVK